MSGKDDIARELDAILDSYSNSSTKPAANEEQEQEFLARFERIKVEIIKPAMEEIGKYLESKGHSYQIEEDVSMHRDNPSVKMEIYPRIPTGDHLQEYEYPTIAFIAEPDAAQVGIEVQDGMPGRPGLARGHATSLDSLTREYVRNQIIVAIKTNFAKRPVRR
jgi:hypothetical protein